jgi:uncharacterized protein
VKPIGAAPKGRPAAFRGFGVARAGMFTIIDGMSGKRQEVPIAPGDAKAPAIEQRLIETTRHGTIPVLDAAPTEAAIDAALARLEAIARERGSAIGMATALPVSIDRIAHWTKAAHGRGIILVPVSALAIKPEAGDRRQTAEDRRG